MPQRNTQPLITDLEFRELASRGLRREVCQKYGYGVGVWAGEKVQVAPYHDRDGRLVAQKIRTADKDFSIVGDMSKAQLFGQKLARVGGKMLVITEGELDALSCCQALNLSWPALSVPNGSAAAASAIEKHLDFLETYEKIILAFDADEPGRAATEAVVSLFSPGRVALVDFGGYKDANEMLVGAGEKALRDAIWSAQVWRPDHIVNFADPEVKARVTAPLSMGTAYPWAGLNAMLYGFRAGELITWTAGTGTGKTAIVSEMVYDLITRQEKRVGIIYLEEGLARAGRRFVGLAMNKPIHLPDVEYDDAEFDQAWEKTLGTGRLHAYDHFGSLDEDVLLNRIRYMIKALHCEIIVLDHISLVVSGASVDTDERKMLDRITTRLKSLAVETDATIHTVCHLRRAGAERGHEEGTQVSLAHLRGTQAIGQLSDAVIAGERNQQSDDTKAKHTTVLRVLKNRYAGITGVACELHWNPETGRLTDYWGTQDKDDDDF